MTGDAPRIDDRPMPEISSPSAIRSLLASARTIAVLGASETPARAGHYVPAYLHEQGYRVVAVNPLLAGKVLWGEVARATLAEITDPIDIVDVFRRPDQLASHLDDITAMRPLPKVVWLQLGIREDAFAASVMKAGIDVVQDRCTLADHRGFSVGRVGRVAPG